MRLVFPKDFDILHMILSVSGKFTINLQSPGILTVALLKLCTYFRILETPGTFILTPEHFIDS